MALGLNFEQTGDGEILKISDNSDDGSDLSGATLVIKYDGTTYSIDISDWSTVGSESVEVTADQVGQTANEPFEDGIYKITYSTTNEDAVAYNTLLSYNVRSCVYNLLRVIPDIHKCDICKNQQVRRALFMFTYLKSLEYSAACGQLNEIDTILLSLQRMCKNPYINECYCN